MWHVVKRLGEIRSLSSNHGSAISYPRHLNKSFPFSELSVLIHKRKGLTSSVWPSDSQEKVDDLGSELVTS